MLFYSDWPPALHTSLKQASIGKSTGIKFPSTSSLSRFHAACEGQFASDGRRRVPPPTCVLFHRSAVPASRARFFAAPLSSRAHRGPSAAMPDRFKNVLLSIDLGILPRFPAVSGDGRRTVVDSWLY